MRCLAGAGAQDDFALQTIGEGEVGFCTANQGDDSIYCDVLDATDECHPPRPLLARFTLHPPAQYTASRALQKFTAKVGGTHEEKAALENASDLEDHITETEIEVATSSVAVFGGTFQLHQAISDKCMQAHQSAAESDPTTLRCSMCDRTRRSKALWFSIRPGFRTRAEGEVIRMGDTVIIETLKMPGMYLHADLENASTVKKAHRQIEVNLSDKPTRFQIVPIAKSIDKHLKDRQGAICGGHFVEIFMKQSMCYLQRSADTGEVRLSRTSNNNMLGDDNSVPTVDARADVLWQIIIPQMPWSGSAIKHSTQEPRVLIFKDAVSGLYLSADESQGGAGLKFVDTDDDRAARWFLVPFEETDCFLSETTQFWMVNAASGYRLCQRSSSKENHHSEDALVLKSPSDVSEADLFVFRGLPEDWVKDFISTTQQIDLLRRFRMAVMGAADAKRGGERKEAIQRIHLHYLLPDSEKESDSRWTGPVLRVLEALLLRLTSSSDLDPLTRNGVVNVALQRLLTELRLVPFLLDELLPAMYELVPPQDINNCVVGPYMLRTVQYAYRVVMMMAKQHPANSLEVFGSLEKIAIFMDAGGSEFRIPTLLVEVFKDAEDLMRACEDAFIERMWRLSTTRRARRFLLFIDTLLSIDEAPLKYNQDRVIEIVRRGMVQGLFDVDFEKDSADRIEYHIGLIQLAASLCAGRHRASIDFFLGDVGLEYMRVLKNLKDDRIDCRIRIVYAKLMKTLFIDREPFELKMTVQPSRIMPPLSGSAEEIEKQFGLLPAKHVDPFSGLPDRARPTAGFTDLKEAITQTFGSVTRILAKNAQTNLFLCELIDLAHQMLLLGLFDDGAMAGKHHDGVLVLGPESISLAANLLSMIDGRTDVMAGLHAEETATPMRFRIDLSETNTLMTMKKKLLRLLTDLFGLRSSTKINSLLNIIAESRELILLSAGNNGSRLRNKSDEFANPMALETFEEESDVPSTPSFEIEADNAQNGDGEDAKVSVHGLAAQAMQNASQIRVYSDPEAEAQLTDGLLDMLRYCDDPELCFGAFYALVFFVSQNFVFVQTLQRVTPLGTKEQAHDFLAAGQEVSEFRRLRKWLHQKSETQQCIDSCKRLIDWCRRPGGQDLMRNLNLEEYITRVLRMRMRDNPLFPELMRCCIQLTGVFCRTNPTNQFIVAGQFDTIVLKLLEDPEYYSEACSMICCVIAENVELSVMYTDRLMKKVGELAQSPAHGRQHGLLALLEQLLLVDNLPVESAQIAICKGAMVSRDLIETVGDIRADEWGEGPTLRRLDAINKAARGDRRAALGVDYYNSCLRILAICACGKMTATELLCVSLIPYDDCLSRLHEVYNNRELHVLADQDDNEDPTARSKACILAFFREVFVETNSEHILRTLRRPANGIWMIEDTADPAQVAPIAKRLLHDLSRLAKKELGLPPPGELRDYLIEQCAMFFIQYVSTIGPSGVAKDEKHAVTAFLRRAGDIADIGRGLVGLTQREDMLLSQLSACVRDYTNDQEFKRGDSKHDLTHRSPFSNVSTSDVSDNAVAWSTFVNAAISTVSVRTVRGTTRLVGQGMISLAQKVWQPIDDDGNPQSESVRRYAGCLVGPLRRRLQVLRTERAHPDEVQKLLTIVDTIRAIPYAVSASSKTELQTAFFKFAEVVELDGNAGRPDLAGAQVEMVEQGWAMLCFEVLCAEELHELHMACVRLLLAMTGGGNKDVQNAIFAQVVETPLELLGLACRRLLRASIGDLKTMRKVAAAQSDGNPGLRVAEQQSGFAWETLSVIANLCKGSHTDLQDYIRSQQGHAESYDVIGDIVK